MSHLQARGSPARVGAGLVGGRRGVPGEADAQFFGAVEKEGVEGGAADADAGAIGEVSGDAGLIGGEGDAGEFGTAAGVDLDAELGESGAGVGHESFAAGFVDGRAAGVGEEDVGSALAEGDGGGEARGSGSGDEDVTVIVTHVSPVRSEDAEEGDLLRCASRFGTETVRRSGSQG